MNEDLKLACNPLGLNSQFEKHLGRKIATLLCHQIIFYIWKLTYLWLDIYIIGTPGIFRILRLRSLSTVATM